MMRQQVTNEEEENFSLLCLSVLCKLIVKMYCRLQFMNVNGRKIISGKKIPLRFLMNKFSKCILLAVGNQENYHRFSSLLLATHFPHFWLHRPIRNGVSCHQECANKGTYKSVPCSIHQSPVSHILSFCVGTPWQKIVVDNIVNEVCKLNSFWITSTKTN